MGDFFISPQAIKSRGVASKPEGRFETIRHHAEDNGWQSALLEESAPRPRTCVTEKHARSVIIRNDSPDTAFAQALNPFRGCESHERRLRTLYVRATSLVQQVNGERDHDSNFATRMRGQGVFAELFRRCFEIACRRHGFGRACKLWLDTSHFVPPRKPSPQGELF